MSNLAELMKDFKPRRVFANDHTRVEVDGILVRVSHENEANCWAPVYEKDGELKGFLISAEDVLIDPSIVRSARVSTDRDTAVVNEKASGLVNFLWRDSHVTPFEGIAFRLRITTPIMFAQPFFRLFAAHNEFSGRYAVIDGDYYTPSNLSEEAQQDFSEGAQNAQELYKNLLEMGVATEMARYVHSYRFFTKFYMTISLRHLMEFLRLQGVPERHESTEFWETRQQIMDLVRHWAPWAFQAWEKSPRLLDFVWAWKEFVKAPPLWSYNSILAESVFDYGDVRLVNKHGSDDFMASCLDDFPDPRRAFGHAGMTFLMRMPIFVFRQWVRHRYGHWSEPRIDFDDVVRTQRFYIPQRLRKQEGKVGAYTYSDMPDELNEAVRILLREHIRNSSARYSRLRRSLGAEVAAMNLPYCFYIPAVWTAPVESLFNFFSLRCDSHAQLEIRTYANVIWRMFAQSFPQSAKLFARHLHYGSSEAIKSLSTP